MRFRTPSHATVVAYVALVVALSGTAIAASGHFGADDLKPVVVRKEKTAAGGELGLASVVARCHRNEELISGAGGWNKAGGTGVPAPTVSQASVITGGKDHSRPDGFIVQGGAPGQKNHLVAQALCLRR